MPIEFRCPHCQRLLRVPDGSGGKQAQCPQCQAMVQVPVLGGPPTPAGPSGPAGASASPFSTNFPAAAGGPGSENPYQAPTAAMLSPHVAAGPGVYPLVRTKMYLGDVLNRTWEIYKAQLGMVILGFFAIIAFNIGASVIMQVISTAVMAAVNDPLVVMLVQAPFQIAIWVAQMWLGLGQIKLYLKIARGQPAEFTELFAAGPYLLTYILSSLLIFMLIMIVLLPFSAPPFIAWWVTNDVDATVIAGVVSGLIGVPLLAFVGISLFMYQYLIVDRNMGVIDSLRTSYEIMSGNRLLMFVYWILGILLYLGGLLACCVGALFTVPFWMFGLAVIYLVVTGQPTADQLMRGAPPPQMPPGTMQPV